MNAPHGKATQSGPSLVVFTAFAALVVIAAHGRLIAAGDANGLPLDSDGWVRLLRVEALWNGGGWYATTLPHLGAPDGLLIHWTRPLDLMILLPAMAMAGFGMTPDSALLLSGGLICPLLHVGCAIAAGWAARLAWPAFGLAPFYAALILVSHPLLTNYSAFGRADHHTLILLAIIIGLGLSLRAVAADGTARTAIAAGAAFGFGIWIGPEVLLCVAPILASFGLIWLLQDDGRHAARQGARICLGLIVLTALGIAVERVPGEWGAVEYDKISIHHLFIAVLAGLVFVVATPLGRAARLTRVIAGGLLSSAAAATLLAVHPGALGVSLSASGSDVNALVLPLIAEMQPIRPWGIQGFADVLIYCGTAAGGIVATAWVVRQARDDDRLAKGIVLLLVLLATLAGSLMARRLALNLAGVAAVAGAGLLGLIGTLPWRAPPQVVLILAAAPLMFGLPLLGTLIPVPADAANIVEGGEPPRVMNEGCDAGAIAPWLATVAPPDARRGGGPIMLTSDINHSSELAWRTPFRQVVAPHHRGGSSFRDMLQVFYATDDSEACRVLQRRSVSFILVCRRDATMDGAFTRRLLAGQAPSWLTEILPPAGTGTGGARLYAIR